MKKKLFVALMMMLMIITGSVFTVSAEGTSGNQTITITAEPPTWELEIPANVSIPFGTTEATGIGVPKITNVSPATFYKGYIICTIEHPGYFTGTREGIGKPMILYTLKSDKETVIPTDGSFSPCYYSHDGSSFSNTNLFISVTQENWNDAPMESYEAVMTYSSIYSESL